MSQFFVDKSVIPPPPGALVELSGRTGNNPVGPDGSGNINIFDDPFAPGIVTRGDAAANTIYIGLSQPVTCGTGQTVNTGTVDLVTLPLGGTAATYTLTANVAGKAATQSGVGGTLFGVARTNGTTVTLISVTTSNVASDLVLSGASFTFVASAGNIILRATGSLGTVINWNGCVTYVSVTGGI